MANFLTKAGFVLKRSCFDHVETETTYLGQDQDTALLTVTKGQALFDKACLLLFNHYRQTHQKINPFSGSYQTFVNNLPDLALLNLDMDDEIDNCAFLEENEIAYVVGKSPERFEVFIQSLIVKLFHTYPEITFECDDCDPIAMILHKQFQLKKKTTSWDTYILG